MKTSPSLFENDQDWSTLQSSPPALPGPKAVRNKLGGMFNVPRLEVPPIFASESSLNVVMFFFLGLIDHHFFMKLVASFVGNKSGLIAVKIKHSSGPLLKKHKGKSI